MGLRLATIYKGVDCEYWKIERIECMYRKNNCDEDDFTSMHVHLVLYKNKTCRMANVGDWLVHKVYVFPHHITTGVKPNEVITEYMPLKDERDKVYETLKTLPEFNGAEDA